MDAFVAVLVQNWPVALPVLVAGVNWGAKWVRWSLIIRRISELEQARRAAQADGVISVEEKADMYDRFIAILDEAKAVAVGLFPNKSKA